MKSYQVLAKLVILGVGFFSVNSFAVSAADLPCCATQKLSQLYIGVGNKGDNWPLGMAEMLFTIDNQGFDVTGKTSTQCPSTPNDNGYIQVTSVKSLPPGCVISVTTGPTATYNALNYGCKIDNTCPEMPSSVSARKLKSHRAM